jgi:hypothetical protein
MTCPNCGGALVIGGWPFCPDHTRGASFNAQHDDIPGGETVENLGPEPVTFYSRSEKRRWLKQHGIEEMVRHVPVPGTDASPHTTSWVSVDLDAARALAERQAHTKATNREPEPAAATVEAVKRAFEELRAR